MFTSQGNYQKYSLLVQGMNKASDHLTFDFQKFTWICFMILHFDHYRFGPDWDGSTNLGLL